MPRPDLHSLARWAALLPIVTFSISYFVAAGMEHVPQCLPNISGCTSISSTGRQFPESWLFKAGTLPLAAVMYMLWRGLAAFLESHGQSGWRVSALRVVAITGAASMIVYALSLGIPGDHFRTVRRIGIDGFALSNFVAQLFFLLSWLPLAAGNTRRLWRVLLALCLAAPVIAIGAEVAKSLGAPRHAVNNVMAWNVLLLQCVWYWLLARLLKSQSARD